MLATFASAAFADSNNPFGAVQIKGAVAKAIIEAKNGQSIGLSGDQVAAIYLAYRKYRDTPGSVDLAKLSRVTVTYLTTSAHHANVLVGFIESEPSPAPSVAGKITLRCDSPGYVVNLVTQTVTLSKPVC